jgi:Asp-tRNA(Asn)/Glu-tRNA(Gln) amidotransferase A subunit family amidase
LQSVRSRASAQSAAKALDELSAEGAEVVPIDLPPAGREERRTYQNRD